MKTFTLLFVASLSAAVACGGSQPPPPSIPLPDEPSPDAKPAEPAPAAATTPSATEQPKTIPIDLTMAPPDTTLKLVRPGTGKKSVLKVAAAQGTKQHVDMAFDFSEKNTVEAEKPQEVIAPTVLVSGDVEAGEAGSNGTQFKLTVTSQDVKDRQGSQVSASEFKTEQMGDITGMTVAGTVAPNGKLGETKLHIDKADQKAAGIIGLIQTLMQPLWPELPTQPIGVGAQWTVTENTKLMDRIAVTRTTKWEVVSHKGDTWQLKGTTAVIGKDQTVEGTDVSKIGGGGTVEVSLNESSFVPQMKSQSTGEFTAKVTLPADTSAGSAAEPTAKPKTKSAQVHVEQGFNVAPATATASAK